MKYGINISKLLSHLVIILGGMFVVFFCIDRVNTAMAFIDNDISKWLLLILSVLSIAQSVLRLACIRRKERALRDNTEIP